MNNDKNLGQFEASLSFDTAFLQFGHVLIGKDIPFEINNHALFICLPNFIAKNTTSIFQSVASFQGTRSDLNWVERDGLSMSYGRVNEAKNGKIQAFCCNKIVISSQEKIGHKNANEISKKLTTWKKTFLFWIEVIMRVDLEQPSLNVDCKNFAESYFIKADDTIALNKNKQKINIIISKTITESDLEKSLLLSKNLTPPPTYYLFLLSSRKHFNQKEYRQSVLDAATAFEIALTEMLDRKLSQNTILERELLNAKCRQISGLHDCLTKLDIEMPNWNEIKKNLTSSRNNCIHQGKEITLDDAKSALEFSTKFIYSSLPI